MDIFKHKLFFSTLICAFLFLFSCSKDDDGDGGNNPLNTTVTIEDGLIAFDVSGFENASMQSDVVYFLNNQYDIKYFNISNDEKIYHNGEIWNISFEQNSNGEISLPEPGEYPIVQGLANTYDQTSFNATVSMFTDNVSDTGTHFGGNNGAIT